MLRIDRSALLVLAGVLLVVLTMGVSAAWFPGLNVGDEQGQTLVGSQAYGASWTANGRVYMLNGTDVAWHVDDADAYFEVQQTPNGTVLAAFADKNATDCGSLPSPCDRTGFQRIDPETEEVISEFSFPIRYVTHSEVHAVDRLPDGGVVLSDMEHERIAIVENGSITWEWRADSFYQPPADPTKRDWLHINDVDHIGDDRFLVSVRNANQLLVVERGQGVTEVINADDDDSNDDSCTPGGQLVPGEDGDVRCGDPDVLDHQHNPQWLGDGAVLVADSENDRIVELHRTNGSWEPAWVRYGAANVQFKWPRDADRLPNGHTLISDTYNGRFVELDTNGSTVWSTSQGKIPYEIDRVAFDEPVGAPVFGESGDVVDDPDAGIPVLSMLAFNAHAVLPGLPYWFGEAHVVIVLFSVTLVAAGGLDWAWSRWRG